MDYYIDFEFTEGGAGVPIMPISLGLAKAAEEGVAGESLYVEYPEMEDVLANANPWVLENVVPYLDYAAGLQQQGDVEGIAAAILQFMGGDPSPRFWGWYSDYDWVCFAQTFGTMMDLPDHFPKFCNDLKMVANILRCHLPDYHLRGWLRPHHAKSDAIWARRAHAYLYMYATQLYSEERLPLDGPFIEWLRPRTV